MLSLLQTQVAISEKAPRSLIVHSVSLISGVENIVAKYRKISFKKSI